MAGKSQMISIRLNSSIPRHGPCSACYQVIECVDCWSRDDFVESITWCSLLHIFHPNLEIYRFFFFNACDLMI